MSAPAKANPLREGLASLNDKGVGVYVHFPFCLKKCGYCDFLSFPADPSDLPHVDYARAVCAELDRRVADLGPGVSNVPLKSVFFGGGTPSLWDPNKLGQVLEAIQSTLPGRLSDEAGVEVTVECNPNSFDRRKAEQLRSVGVNRVSLGVQSLDAERLGFLGRLHGPDQALEAVRTAVEVGHLRVSADLIHSVAGQTPEQAARETTILAELGVTHLSLYALTIEPGTQFGALAKRGQLPLISEGLAAECYEATRQAAKGLGFEHYEISNFARERNYAEHNLLYWRGEAYLGLGCGAFGTVEHQGEVRRYRNTLSPERYLRCDWHSPDVDPWRRRAEGPVHSAEVLSPQTRLSERILLGLRLAEGVDLERAARELGVEGWTKARRRAAARLLDQKELEQNNGRLRIPDSHWLFSDAVIRQLL